MVLRSDQRAQRTDRHQNLGTCPTGRDRYAWLECAGLEIIEDRPAGGDASSAVFNRPYRQELPDTGPSGEGEGEGKSLVLEEVAHRHGPSRANTQFKI